MRCIPAFEGSMSARQGTVVDRCRQLADGRRPQAGHRDASP